MSTGTAKTTQTTAETPKAAANDAPVVRRLWPVEADALRRHLCRLSREDRVLRFGRPVTNRYIHTYVDRIDWFSNVVIGAVIDGELRASGILAPLGWRLPLEGSAAVAVEADYQGQRLGTVLTERLLEAARNRMVRRVFMLCLTQNERMQKIAAKYGGHVDKFRDESEAQFELELPTPASLAHETMNEGLALGRTVLGRVPVLGKLAATRAA